MKNQNLNKKTVLYFNIIAIIAIVAIFLLGKLVSESIIPIGVKWFFLFLASCVVLISMALTYLSLPNKGNRTSLIFVFVLSLLTIILSFALAYSMIYYIYFPDNVITFNYPNHESEALMFFDFVYYSVVTFTTLGYGDITPVSLLAKIYTMIEALIFVIYISIIVLNFARANVKEEH